MKKIKIFDDSVVDLRGQESDNGFKVKEIDEEVFEKKNLSKIEHDIEAVDIKSSNLVRIRFDKFLTLLSKYEYEVAISKFFTQEVIISADLLADLANPPEIEVEEIVEEKKFPLAILLGGIILGIIITWLILK
jgi:hypothetical protein